MNKKIIEQIRQERLNQNKKWGVQVEADREAEYQQQCQEEVQNWQDEILITELETTIEDLPF